MFLPLLVREQAVLLNLPLLVTTIITWLILKTLTEKILQIKIKINGSYQKNCVSVKTGIIIT